MIFPREFLKILQEIMREEQKVEGLKKSSTEI